MLGWLFKILSINRPGMNRREFLQASVAGGAALTVPDLFAQAAGPAAAPSVPESTLMLQPNLQGLFDKGKKDLPSPVDAFLSQAEEIVRRMPRLDMLHLNNAGGSLFGVPWKLDRLAKSPHLLRVKTLFLFKC